MKSPIKSLLDTPGAPGPPVREILRPPHDGERCIQPRDFSAKREVVEGHNRMRQAAKYFYANSKGVGDAATLDPTKKYLCGGCNQLIAGKWCLMILESEGPVSPTHGSCKWWERKRACDPEQDRSRKVTKKEASYAETAATDGWGCKNCTRGDKAFRPDSLGNTIYCTDADARVDPGDCCEVNEAEEETEPA